MRTIDSWGKQVLPHYLSLLSPRIQRDLQSLPFPTNLPDIDDGLFIYGPTESGKTILASWLLLEEQKKIYLEGGPQSKDDVCELISADRLIEEIKSTFDSSSLQTEQSVISHYSSIRLLVLDDFGTTRPTDWVLSVLYSIINRRYEWIKKTVFTSNLTLEEIARVYGDDRITSRIDRMCRKVRKTKNWI
jgi:DNA replication protein DnaC